MLAEAWGFWDLQSLRWEWINSGRKINWNGLWPIFCSQSAGEEDRPGPFFSTLGKVIQHLGVISWMLRTHSSLCLPPPCLTTPTCQVTTHDATSSRLCRPPRITFSQNHAHPPTRQSASSQAIILSLNCSTLWKLNPQNFNFQLLGERTAWVWGKNRKSTILEFRSLRLYGKSRNLVNTFGW